MKAKYAVPALAALLLLPAAQVWAQGGAAAPAADAGKRIGTINMRQVIVSTAEGKQASAELQSQFTPRQTELENLGKQIEDARARGRQTTISDDERNRLARQIDAWTRLYQRKQQDLQEDIEAAQNEVIQLIGSKVIDVLNRYAKENGYSVILDVSNNATQVMFADTSVDTTQDIIRLYDQAHPLRGGATAPAQTPAQPRPQPGQARPPATQPPPKPPQK